MSASSSSITKRPSPLTPQPLCLLCSSSIQFASKFATNHKKTSCCQRIICGTCVETKGRLASWEPCLACEGKWKTGKGKRSVTAGDGGREEGGREEQFVLGDEDDEDEKDDEGLEAEKVESEDQEKAADLNDNGKDADDREVEDDGKKQDDAQLARRHIVLKGETLMGIALKYRLDPMTLLTLNSLPHSALYTNPHLIQTRHSILLTPLSPPSPPPEIRAQLAHERALARFAKITKESDPDVRKVYVELAEAGLTGTGSSSFEGWEEGQGEKRKEAGAEGEATVEHRAVDRFIEDGEWEREQLEGSSSNGPKIRGFPIVGSSSSSAWTGGAGGGKGKAPERASWWSRLAGGGGAAAAGGVSAERRGEKAIKA